VTNPLSDPCVFCEIIASSARRPFIPPILALWPDAIALTPLKPVCRGHILVIPRAHVADFAEDPMVSAVAMARAAELAKALRIDDANIITSRGPNASQSVYHLHLHIVPRRENDGLALPWYSGKSRKVAAHV
jgi:histidine triad (HIT) family protein